MQHVEYKTEFYNDGSVKTDEHGNIIGYVSTFVQKVFDAVKNAWDYIVGKTMDAFFKYF